MKQPIALIAVLMSALCILSPACAGDPERDALLLDILELRHAVQRLENENRAMWQNIRGRNGAAPYIVIDTTGNKLHMREGEQILLEAIVSTGSGKMLEETGGRKWTFNTPKGIFTILKKESDPVWYKPDWAYVEDNLPIPPPDAPERMVKGVLGKYALTVVGSYKIHGTPHKHLLGRPVSHGCIRLRDEDMETLYNSVDVGTKVYIY